MSSENRRMLVVSNDFPYPPNHGGRVDIWRRLQVLRRIGFTVDLVATVRELPSDDDIAAVRRVVENVTLVQRRAGLGAILGIRPYQLASRDGLRSIPLSASYLAVVLESEHVQPVLDNPALSSRFTILRVHNDEVQFFRDLAKSSPNPARKLFYLAEGVRMSRVTRRLMMDSDLLWFIAQNELEEAAHRYPRSTGRFWFLPPDVQERECHTRSLQGSQAIFAGTLSLPSNAHAIEWYLDFVHDKLLDLPEYRLVIAGRTGGSSLASLKAKTASHPRVTLVEDPLELSGLYDASAVFVNPVWRGAGLKLKTITAIQEGLPVVSTTHGVQGSGLLSGKHVLLAETGDDFALAVRTVLLTKPLARSLVHAAQRYLSDNYNQTEGILQSMISAGMLPVSAAAQKP